MSNEVLKSYIERAERLDEQAQEVATDKRELFKEARANGFDVPAIRLVLKERKIERDAAKKRKSDEVEAIAETYRHQLNLF